MPAHPVIDKRPAVIDKRLVRQRFERAAPGYEAANALAREVGVRMVERLELVKLQPARILDAGSGTGQLARELAARYPKSAVVELDLSLAMLRAGVHAGGWGRRLLEAVRPDRHQRVCGDIEHLPLAAASVELVCSNLVLPWVNSPDAALRECHRVLARGGLLMFTTLGPDTLTELRAALGPAAVQAIHPFADMHDIGDLLVRSGFADPVMDAEHLTLTYPDLPALLRELHASGGRTALAGRPAGLRGRGWLTRLETRYSDFAPRAAGHLPARSRTATPGSRKRDRGVLRTAVQWCASSGGAASTEAARPGIVPLEQPLCAGPASLPWPLGLCYISTRSRGRLNS